MLAHRPMIRTTWILVESGMRHRELIHELRFNYGDVNLNTLIQRLMVGARRGILALP
jgi:hypothetical protein